jgi:plasmid stabilization system protein ParE
MHCSRMANSEGEVCAFGTCSVSPWLGVYSTGQSCCCTPVSRKAESVLRRLEKFPESGRSIPEFPGLSHRKVIVRPYRFLYRVWGKRSGSSRFSMVRHCLKGRITRNHLTNACIRLLRLSRLVLTHKPRQPRLQVKQTYSRPQWRMGC